jgi:predicted esterase
VRPLVVFLHGMVQPGHTDEATENRVRERFGAAGFDVFTPRGKLGLCEWSDEAKQSLCWPSDERSLDTARAIVSEWSLATARPTIVVGFSNGGAFALLLALHGLVPACGISSLHGFPAGRLHPEPGRRMPLFLIAGREAAWEPEQMIRTTEQLKAVAWPHEARMHDGGHAVSDRDLDEAIGFARQAVRTGCAERDINSDVASPR